MNKFPTKKIELKQRSRSFFNLWQINKPPKFEADFIWIGKERWLIIDLAIYSEEKEVSILFNPLIPRVLKLLEVLPDCYLFWFDSLEQMERDLDWPHYIDAYLFIVLIG